MRLQKTEQERENPETVTAHSGKRPQNILSFEPESNQRPKDDCTSATLQSSALPAELSKEVQAVLSWNPQFSIPVNKGVFRKSYCRQLTPQTKQVPASAFLGTTLLELNSVLH